MIGLRVLVLDENRLIFEAAEAALFESGAGAVLWARNFEQAALHLKSEPIDLVLVDRDVGGPSRGIACVKRMRSTAESPLPFVPIALLSTGLDERCAKEARDAGVNGVITKPFSTSTLRKRILHILTSEFNYVRSSDYLGPDRRHGHNPLYNGPERRAPVRSAVRHTPSRGSRQDLGLTALVVDDQLVNRQVLRAMLEKIGAQVHEAEDYQAAAKILSRVEINKIFLDIHMPKVNGIQFANAVRKTDWRHSRIPIIAVTGDLTLSQESLAPAGFDGFISKPISLDAVRHALAVERREACGPA